MIFIFLNLEKEGYNLNGYFLLLTDVKRKYIDKSLWYYKN